MNRPGQPVKHQWLSALVMSFPALPLIAGLPILICTYDFAVRFGQILFRSLFS